MVPTLLQNSIVRQTVSHRWLGSRLQDPIVQQIVADPPIEVLTAGPDRATDRGPPSGVNGWSRNIPSGVSGGSRDIPSDVNVGNRDTASGASSGNRDIPSGVNGGNRDTASGANGGNRDIPSGVNRGGVLEISSIHH